MNAHSRARGEWRWIYLPLLGGFLLLALLLSALILTSFGTLSAWADVALILFALPLLLGGVLTLGIMAVSAYGVARLLGAIAAPFETAQSMSEKIAVRARRILDTLLRPFLALLAGVAGVRAIGRWLRSLFS